MAGELHLDEISPAELLADILNRLCDPDLAPAGVVVGPADDAQQQAGVIQMVDAGMPALDLYTPTLTVNAQVRCLAGTLEVADRIVRGVQRDLKDRCRVVARMASTDQRYLVHSINVIAGPSMHYDSAETYETLLFADLRIGTQPL